MIDPTTEFFAELARKGHEPLVDKVNGSIRFDITDGKRKRRWLVSMDRGNVTVSRRNAAADVVVRGEAALVDRIVTGETNAMAAVLRGALQVEGEVEPLMFFQRLFPGPPITEKRR
jgi:predicted lipid carrier protein YhbT